VVEEADAGRNRGFAAAVERDGGADPNAPGTAKVEEAKQVPGQTIDVQAKEKS